MASHIPTTERGSKSRGSDLKAEKATKPPSVLADPERAESGRMVNMVEQLQTQRSALQAANASAPSKELEHLRRDNERLRGDYEKLRGDYEKIRGDYEKMRGDNDALRMKLAEAEQSLNVVLQQNGSERLVSTNHAGCRPSPMPQAVPVPVHRPYLPREEDEVDGSPLQASDEATGGVITDHHSAYPGVGGVFGEVVELRSDSGAVESVGSKLTQIHTMLKRSAEREAYTTTALVTALSDSLRLNRSEELYTIWRSFGGDTDLSACRSRLNVLQSLLLRYTGETLVLHPTTALNPRYGIVIPEEEVSGFVSAIASRLPKLTKLKLVGYSTWPLSSKYYSRHKIPFENLQKFLILDTPWEPQVVIESLNTLLTRGQTSLQKCIITQRLAPADCNLVQFRKRFKGLLELR